MTTATTETPVTQREKVLAMLEEPIPRSVIRKREAGNGVKLDYLEGWYVIDRLNKVFGHGNWSVRNTAEKVHEGTYTDSYGKTVYTCHYKAQVQLLVRYPWGEMSEYHDYGYGDGSDKKNPGKAHELAIKESVTDGLKRCARNLGMSMGLALYDKTQANVNEDEKETKEVEKTETTTFNRDIVLKKITTLSRILIDQKRVTKDQLLNFMQTNYGVDSKDKMTDVQLTEFWAHLDGSVTNKKEGTV